MSTDTGQIIVVTPQGMTHIQPAKNKAVIDRRNKYKAPDKRLKYFPYDPAVPADEYVRKAKGSTGAAANDFATKKLAEKNEQLASANEKLSEKTTKQNAEILELKKKLKEAEALAKQAGAAAKNSGK